MTQPPPHPSRLFGSGSRGEAARLAEVLRRETVGGALLLVATALALVWANSRWSGGYADLRDVHLGPSSLHLRLSLGEWAADGLLAIFFFVAGLELKREFVAGDLRDPRRSALPVLAAVGGMIVPAVLYLTVNHIGDGSTRGWAIPTATDIAFALAVLAVIGAHLPAAVRTFLLTLAVVDDLLAIVLIAVFFTDDLSLGPLVAAAAPLAAYVFLLRRGVRSWWLLLPLAATTWALVHASGVHATVAGVLLGLAVPVSAATPAGTELAERLERRVRPLSAGFAVPVFAFFAAGVTLGGGGGLGVALRDPVTIGVVVGLVVGKPIGVAGATWLVCRLTHAELDPALTWRDVFGLALLAGMGFTVSLLFGDLAFGAGSAADDHVKVGVLAGSLLAAVLATLVLRVSRRSPGTPAS